MPPPAPLLRLLFTWPPSSTLTPPMSTTIPPLNRPRLTLPLTWPAETNTLPCTSRMPPQPAPVLVAVLPVTVLPATTYTVPVPARMPPTAAAELLSTWLALLTVMFPSVTAIPPAVAPAVLLLTELPPSIVALPRPTTIPPPEPTAVLPATELAIRVIPLPAQMPPPIPVAPLGASVVPTALWSRITRPLLQIPPPLPSCARAPVAGPDAELFTTFTNDRVRVFREFVTAIPPPLRPLTDPPSMVSTLAAEPPVIVTLIA